MKQFATRASKYDWINTTLVWIDIRDFLTLRCFDPVWADDTVWQEAPPTDDFALSN